MLIELGNAMMISTIAKALQGISNIYSREDGVVHVGGWSLTASLIQRDIFSGLILCPLTRTWLLFFPTVSVR
jgi:hypothetical protein